MGGNESSISLSTSLQYYKRPDIQGAMLACADSKEIAVKFGEKGFGKRPDILQYKNDILELAKQGATSFHSSEELWHDPLRLAPSLRKQELDSLRKGWDLILDIDCKELPYSAITADILIKAIKYNGIKNITCKFSGNHGFHIAVPFESFPERVNNVPINELFPEAPRRIAAYLKNFIAENLSKALLESEGYDANKIAERFGKSFNEIITDGNFDPFKILEIDTILISSRHMYRMPYSLNEKSGLVSLPIDPNKVLQFNKADAAPEKIKVNEFKFLDRSNVVKNEAGKLILQAYDFSPKDIAEEDSEMEKTFMRSSGKIKYDEMEQFQQAVPEDFFPPCIKMILNGLQDGKKRSMFILVNFLSSCNWEHEKIKELLHEWNKKNPEPLREVLINGQMRYHQQQKKSAPPPNCSNKMYYQDFHICKPDSLCQKIKNPVSYAKRRVFYQQLDKKAAVEKDGKAKRILTEEQKQKMADARKQYKEFREKMKAAKENKDDN